jgi:integrase
MIYWGKNWGKKMKISIEKRKAKGDKLTLRLIYYYGYSTDDNGKVTHNREREALDLFLYEKPKTPIEKQHNKDTLNLAESIKAKRTVEYESGKHGFKTNVNAKKSFLKFFLQLMDEKKKNTTSSNWSVWDSCYKHLIKYISKSDLYFNEITPGFISGFKDYLQNEAKTKSGKLLSKNSASSYFNKVRATINTAHLKGIISENPLHLVKSIKPENNKREFLEVSELKLLVKTECKYDVLKRAFLFSCLTGMRWSDINKLLWNDIKKTDDGYRIIFHQQKTKGLQYLDLSKQAYDLMDDPEDNGRAFQGLRYSSYMNVELLRWCLAAGISKHITFHAGRHTFAVTQLTLGTDIYTVSKLLGHSELKTTQIYADIIDSQRKEAMLKIPDIGL